MSQILGFFIGLKTMFMEERVRKNTKSIINANIDKQIKECAALSLPQEKDAITQRIKELEREWDVERALDLNMSIVALIGLAPGVLSIPGGFSFPR